MITKRIVYVIELDVPEHMGNDPYYINEMFKGTLVTWSSYCPLEDNAPIRLNISYDKVEEV